MPRAAFLALLLGYCYAAIAGPARSGDAAAVPAVGGDAAARSTATQLPQLQLSGRFHPGKTSSGVTLPQLMTWTGSSVTVRFTGSAEVAVKLDGRLTAVPAADRWVNLTRSDLPFVVFQFELDGEVSTAQVIKASPVLWWSRTGLSLGAHTLTITRASEPRYGAVWLRTIRLDAAGAFWPPVASPKIATGRRVLFIGDSYTAGAGNTGAASCKGTSPTNSNPLLAYGPVAARALRAEYQSLGWSAALLNIYRYTEQDSLPPAVRRAYWPRVRDVWKRADALDSASQYTMANFVPQVVVLAAGTNDFGNVSLSARHNVQSGDVAKLPSMQDWVDEHEAFVREIIRTYPSAIIINLVFPLQQQLVGVMTLEQTAAYVQYFAASSARFQAARLKNVYTLQLDGSAFPNSNWCFNHPNVATHALIADQLAAFVRSVLPSWAA